MSHHHEQSSGSAGAGRGFSAGAWQDVMRRASAMAGGGPDLRIGDSERAAMADLLGTHYSDGRLDEAEFHERVERAMSAKTRGDLAGLLDDLPPLDSHEPLPIPPRPRRSHVLAAAALAVVLTLAVATAFAPWHFPWLLFAVVAFFLLRHERHRRYRRCLDQ